MIYKTSLKTELKSSLNNNEFINETKQNSILKAKKQCRRETVSSLYPEMCEVTRCVFSFLKNDTASLISA